MTYIELINRFWKLNKEWNFSSTETKLYFLLLDTANSMEWKNPVQMSHTTLTKYFEESEATVRRARHKLRDADLITFEAARSKADRSKYFIIGINEERDTQNEKTRHPNVTNRDTQTSPKNDAVTDCFTPDYNENNFERDTQTSPNVTPKPQKRDTQTSPNILRQDIDKIKSPEKENYYVVKEKVPQNDDFEALLDFYFAEERKIELEAFAMNLHISIEQMRALARSCVNEWHLNNHRHQNRQDAVKHLTNHIRAKALKEPPPPVLPVEERRAQLWEEIKQAADEIIATNGDCALTADDCTQFYNYWIELNNAGTKMRFETQPFFTTTNRLRSWIAAKDNR